MANTKILKSALAASLAVMMPAAFAAAPLVANAATVKITADEETTAHDGTNAERYVAYQIFAGDVANVDGQLVLSNVKWGSGINKDAPGLLEAIKGVSGFNGIDSLDDPAAIVKIFSTLSEDPEGTGDATAFSRVLDDYLKGDGIKSSYDKGTKNFKIDGLNGYYIIVDKYTGKAEGISSNMMKLIGAEEVTIEAKADTPTIKKTVTDVDYGIGDDIVYTLEITLPENYDSFPDYYLKITDTLGAGLDAVNEPAVSITVNNEHTLPTATTSYSGQSLSIEYSNLKGAGSTVAANDVITVTYHAKLNANAVSGNAGNPNDVKMEYSNNPNKTSEHGEATDEEKVFSYGISVKKTGSDKDGERLADATFKLSRKSDGKFATIVDGKITGWLEDEDSGTALTTTEKSDLVINGLDEGTYVLKETKAPAGYNTMDNIEFQIEGTVAEGAVTETVHEITGRADNDASITNGGNPNDGVFALTLVDQKGNTMPGTGGMGTTIFYCVGGALILGAVGYGVYYSRKNRRQQDAE